jgi:predicted DNA-binding transcriptional regulator YafY
MPKRPATSDTLSLALALLRRIPRSHYVTSQQLHEWVQAEGFARNERSIQRLLATLNQKFSLDRDDSSKPYGYKWKPQAPGFNVPALNPQESLVLLLAEKHLRTLLPDQVMKSMDIFFAQARNNLSTHDEAVLERQWLGKVRVVSETQPLLPPKLADGVLAQTSQALYNNQWLDLDYTNARGERKQHRVMPLGLAQQGPRIYLVCRFEGYDNERSMAMHRIHTAKATGLNFARPQFDLADYDNDGRFGVGDGQRIKLRFCVSKGAGLHLLESPLSTDQVVVVHEDHYEISATVVQTMVLDKWLAGFGEVLWGVEKST